MKVAHVLQLVRRDGRIHFRNCLARARQARRINTIVNQRSALMMQNWQTRSRLERVRSYMHELRQLLDLSDEESAA
jgi:hypothetical protein